MAGPWMSPLAASRANYKQPSSKAWFLFVLRSAARVVGRSTRGSVGPWSCTHSLAAPVSACGCVAQLCSCLAGASVASGAADLLLRRPPEPDTRDFAELLRHR